MITSPFSATPFFFSVYHQQNRNKIKIQKYKTGRLRGYLKTCAFQKKTGLGYYRNGQSTIQSEYIFIHTHQARRATGRRIKYTTRKSNIDSRYGVHVTCIHFDQQKITKCDLARIIIVASPETIGKWSAIFNTRQIQNGHKPFNIPLSFLISF